MSPNQKRLQETDARYFKQQMKNLKQAKQNGNHGRANRIAVEILQYFGIDEDSETPIINSVEDVGNNYENMLRDR